MAGPAGERSGRQADRAGWVVLWAAPTLALALAMTAADALLLQRSRSFFTGGFLAADHLTSRSESLVFLAVSLVADVSIVGLVVAATCWAAGRVGLTRRATVVAAAALAAGPLVMADIVSYQLLLHLSDRFDLGLMFDLAGRSPGELLAVSWAPVMTLGSLAGAAALVVAGTVWMLNRRPAGGGRSPRFSGARVLVLGAVLLAAGAAGTTAARLESDVLDNGLRRKPSGQLLGLLVNAASDVDGDGFGLLGRPPDPDLFDARVYPYALEIPGNGIDENGVGGDLPPGPAYSEPVARPQWTARPDILLIVLESFRADALGATARGTQVTPVLDGLAARGVAVSHAYSHNGFTVQSRRHVFTGSVADLTASTLVDDFAANGYETAYFSGQDESFGGDAQGVGFDRADVSYDARHDRDRRYSTFTTPGSLAVSHAVLNERIGGFLETRARQAPLFLYVNYHDTHYPYHHAGIAPIVSDTIVPVQRLGPARAAELREMYLNTAANVDRAIGDLLGRVSAALGREPAVVVLADHGESLYEERFLGHGYALDDAQTRIPLVVANLPATIVEPFGQADLRHILHAAIGAAPGAPRVVRDPGRRVFQYLGRIERAAQIAFVTTGGRVMYDLRARQARIGEGPWTRHDDLAPGDQASVEELIHTWERMLLARHATGLGEE